MSMIINPNMILLMNPQLSQIAAWSRGALRNGSEYVGLGVSVPSTRKMDYMFRDMLMAIVGTYIIENTYKISEQYYTTPNFVKFLRLDQLKDMYKPGDVRTPNFIQPHQIKNLHHIPDILSDRFYGSHIGNKIDTYYLVPNLLEHQTIPALEAKIEQLSKPVTWSDHLVQFQYWFTARPDPAQAKKELEGQIIQARFMAHHLRQIFNPKEYIQDYLVGHGRITQAEAQLIHDMLKQTDTVAKQFENVQTILKKEIKNPSLRQQLIRDPKFLKLKHQSLHIKNKETKKLLDLIHQLDKNPAFDAQKSEFFGPLVSLSDKDLLSEIRGSSFTHDILNHGFRDSLQTIYTPILKTLEHLFNLEVHLLPKDMLNLVISPPIAFWKIFETAYNNKRSHEYAPHRVMEAIRQEALIPWMEESAKHLPHDRRQLLEELTTKLVNNKINLARLNKVLKTTEVYLKIPFSVLSMFFIYGLIANNFEAKFLLPYQRQIVKEKGNSKDFMLPGYLCPIPAGFAYYLTRRLPIVQKLGHVGSFMVSGAVGLVTMGLSAILGFEYLYGRTPPEKTKPHL